jgi:acetyltransferase-like isoleucine patch superfamily enzyme
LWINPQVYLKKPELKGPIIRKGARIGAGAVILPGIEIGEYCQDQIQQIS